MVSCPECEADIDIDEEDLDEGDVLTCDECGATVNVVSKNPLELESEADDEEDEEDADFDEDEDEEEDEEDWK
jgi:alpha-aminoadipate carrier protein LysW